MHPPGLRVPNDARSLAYAIFANLQYVPPTATNRNARVVSPRLRLSLRFPIYLQNADIVFVT